jgi:type III secretion protein V
VLELAAELLALARAEDARFVREGLAALREQVWRELGFRVPPIAIREVDLAPGGWRLLVDEVPAANGSAPAGEVLSLASPEELALVGLAGVPEVDPVTERPATSLHAASAARAAALGPVRGPLERVAADVAGAIGRAAPQLLGVQEAQVLLDALEPASPALVREAARQLPAALIADVLRRLLEEGVSIRPLRRVLEAMLEAGGAVRGPAALSDACRRALRRHIAHRCGEGGTVHALLLDPAAEELLRAGRSDETLALEPDVASALLDRLGDELRGLETKPVLLASGDVRRALRSLVSGRFPRLPVLAYDELPPEQPVRPLGRVAAA